MSLNGIIQCGKLKNSLCRIATKSQVVTEFNDTKSRLRCTNLEDFNSFRPKFAHPSFNCIDNSIANLSLQAIGEPKLNFGGYLNQL